MVEIEMKNCDHSHTQYFCTTHESVMRIHGVMKVTGITEVEYVQCTECSKVVFGNYRDFDRSCK